MYFASLCQNQDAGDVPFFCVAETPDLPCKSMLSNDGMVRTRMEICASVEYSIFLMLVFVFTQGILLSSW